jgi:hypothetical protein
MLEHGGAALDPIAAVDVGKAALPAHDRVVNVAADHALYTAATSLAGKRLSNAPMKLTAFLTFSFAHCESDQ